MLGKTNGCIIMTRTKRIYNKKVWKTRFPCFYHPYKVMPIAYQNEESKYHTNRKIARLEQRYYELEVNEYIYSYIHKSIKVYGKGCPSG